MVHTSSEFENKSICIKRESKIIEAFSTYLWLPSVSNYWYCIFSIPYTPERLLYLLDVLIKGA